MKKVMLIGDSIRQGYQADVQEILKNEYEVWGSPDNCRFAKYTLNELGRMFKGFSSNITEKQTDNGLIAPTEALSDNIIYPDIIHWNNGLWDTSIVCEEDGAFTPIDEYISYISKILRELRKMTDKIIFATTTPVKPQNPNQKIEIIKEYNKAVTEFMKKENVVINDLYSFVNANIDAYIGPDNIHLSAEGKLACANEVAKYIRAADGKN